MDRRTFLWQSALIAGIPLACGPAPSQSPRGSETVFRPETFGAVGDGRTNDSQAFAALSRAVNAAGGGVVELRPVTYIVGAQIRSGGEQRGYAFNPVPLLAFRGCRRPLEIRGNGARLRCAAGLRFGTFDSHTGTPTQHALPYTGLGELATPYFAMISIGACDGHILIQDMELDGNLSRLEIGGKYGDAGWQIPCHGIWLGNNRGNEILRNVYSHHHAVDGIVIDGDDDEQLARRVERRIEGLRSELNARQGCSIIGGRGYAFRECRFNHTGRAGLASPPGAGVDIEAEGGKINRDHRFERCEFSDNAGCGILAESGDNAGATFLGCTFVGTASWSAWPRAPRFRFDNCSFAGAVTNCFGDHDSARATQFHNCTFRDESSRSPTGSVYYGNGPIVALSGDQNVLFDRCSFRLKGKAALPWTSQAIYSDCVMEQSSRTLAYPRGIYRGHNTIRGNVALEHSKIVGQIELNGRRLP